MFYSPPVQEFLRNKGQDMEKVRDNLIQYYQSISNPKTP